jgi:hypothetical protein
MYSIDTGACIYLGGRAATTLQKDMDFSAEYIQLQRIKELEDLYLAKPIFVWDEKICPHRSAFWQQGLPDYLPKQQKSTQECRCHLHPNLGIMILLK